MTTQILEDHKTSWSNLTHRSIEITKTPSFEEWEELAPTFSKIRSSLSFWIGDWMNIGEELFGEEYTQALSIFEEYDFQVLANYKSICKAVPASVRNENLSFSHHQHVRKYEMGDQQRLLRLCERASLTSTDLRVVIKGIESDPDLTISKVCKWGVEKFLKWFALLKDEKKVNTFFDVGRIANNNLDKMIELGEIQAARQAVAVAKSSLEDAIEIERNNEHH